MELDSNLRPTEGCLTAALAGWLRIDLHGVCLFPAVDMPDWHRGEWLHNGLCDLEKDGGELKRVPFQPYVDELRRWQKRLNRVTELDADPFSDPVDLADIMAAAERMRLTSDKNWQGG